MVVNKEYYHNIMSIFFLKKKYGTIMILNEMTIKLDMFGALMKNIIMGNLYSTQIDIINEKTRESERHQCRSKANVTIKVKM
jgi:hypothetical protein